MLERAQLLDAMSGSRLDAIDLMRRARIDKADKDSMVRAALAEARRQRVRADIARAAADAAQASAVTARDGQQGRAAAIESEKSEVERQLVAARAGVAGLEAQRAVYQGWLREKEREEVALAAAALAQMHAIPRHPGKGDATAPDPMENAVARVISRAMSQLGVPYVWGGGNTDGPTQGVRDGGVADSYGDYHKIGFDCSGLMMYAFAGADVDLPHHSGHQAEQGRQVLLSSRRPGDMLFWGSGGRINHVALYIGDDRMIEAPYSGSRVRVASVRTGGIMPYAVRIL
jgi:cell wall-associated NlpC family hydrolase